jgi:hypothetical protein
MRFADHPTVLVEPVHRLVAISWNGWSRSIGIGGRDQLDLANNVLIDEPSTMQLDPIFLLNLRPPNLVDAGHKGAGKTTPI